MADKKLNSITFPGIADRYILDSGHVEYDPTEVYSDGTVGKAIGEKANTNGYYENLGSGYADNLATDIRAASQVPYGFQTAGGSVDIGDREYLNAVVGGSLPINQLAGGTMRTAQTKNNVAYTPNNDGTFTLNGTSDSNDYWGVSPWPGSAVVGHKYFISEANGNGSASTFGLCFGSKTIVAYGNHSAIVNCASASQNVGYAYESGVAINNVTLKPVLIDLTLLLGPSIADYIYTLESGTAGAGVAWCKQRFPKIFNAGYIAYNAGTMEHVTGVSSHDTIGFNQFNEATVLASLGFVEQSDGSWYMATPSDVSPNETLWENKTGYTGQVCISYTYKTVNSSGSQGARFKFVYADGSTGTQFADNMTTYADKVLLSTFGKQVERVVYDYGSGSNSTWWKNVNINLSWDGSRDGEFESYIKRTYALDDSLTLRGIPKLDASNNLYYDGDRYAYDGTVTRRYGIVDLGSLTYISAGADKLFYTSGVNTLIRKASGNAEVLDWAVCSSSFKYVSYNAIGTSRSYEMCVSTAGNILLTLDTGRTYTGTEVANALSGVYLVYELATPTTESADPYQQVQIVDDFGTEEFVTTGLVPVGHNSEYPVNLKAKLEMTPNSPSGNGDYVLQQSSGVNTYVDLGATNTITGIIGRIEALEALHQ